MIHTMFKVSAIVLLLCLIALPLDARAVCVKVSKATLYARPSKRAEKTWEVKKHTPLRRLSKQGAWLEVEDVDGDRHWVSQDVVTSSFQCAVISVSQAHGRKGPGMQYPRVTKSPLLRYATLRVLAKKSEWYRVATYDNAKLWIRQDLIWVQ